MSSVSRPLRPQWRAISQKDFREMYSQLGSFQDLAAFWGIPASQIAYYAFGIDKDSAYRTFSIARRHGQPRLIEAPSRTLKYIQRIMHESLTRMYNPHPAVHGFTPNRSVATNARVHLHQRYVLNIDLADFFPSITRQRVFGRLAARPYELQPGVANVIASLATNRYGQLPQGSPSSPVIANMVTAELDTDLAHLCGEYRCWYTRYADDITISISRGEMPPQIARYPNANGTGQVVIGDRLADIIERHSFRINHRKSRLQSYWTRQMCTGLVINGDRPSPRKPYLRNLRSLVDHWSKRGWQDAAQILNLKEGLPIFEDRPIFVNYMMGKIGYLRMVRGEDDKASKRLYEIVASIPQYH